MPPPKKRQKRKEAQGKLMKENEITEEMLCSFCNTEGKITEGKTVIQNLIAGHFYKLSNKYYHYHCLLFSEGANQVGNVGILGYSESEILKTLRNSVECCICKRTGATIRCQSKKCKKMYHFNCGFKKQHQFVIDNLTPNKIPDIFSWCKTHAFKQTRRKEPYREDNCMICQDDETWKNPGPGLGKVVCNVCGFIYHHDCVQTLAISTGQHQLQDPKNPEPFRCSFHCINPDFVKDAIALGIYLPIKDAEVETDEMYGWESYHRNSCIAKTCLLCPPDDEKEKGRFVDKKGDKQWELIGCDICSAGSIHIECGKLNPSNIEYYCEVCASEDEGGSEDEAEEEGEFEDEDVREDIVIDVDEEVRVMEQDDHEVREIDDDDSDDDTDDDSDNDSDGSEDNDKILQILQGKSSVTSKGLTKRSAESRRKISSSVASSPPASIKSTLQRSSKSASKKTSESSQRSSKSASQNSPLSVSQRCSESSLPSSAKLAPEMSFSQPRIFSTESINEKSKEECLKLADRDNEEEVSSDDDIMFVSEIKRKPTIIQFPRSRAEPVIKWAKPEDERKPEITQLIPFIPVSMDKDRQRFNQSPKPAERSQSPPPVSAFQHLPSNQPVDNQPVQHQDNERLLPEPEKTSDEEERLSPPSSFMMPIITSVTSVIDSSLPTLSEWPRTITLSSLPSYNSSLSRSKTDKSQVPEASGSKPGPSTIKPPGTDSDIKQIQVIRPAISITTRRKTVEEITLDSSDDEEEVEKPSEHSKGEKSRCSESNSDIEQTIDRSSAESNSNIEQTIDRSSAESNSNIDQTVDNNNEQESDDEIVILEDVLPEPIPFAIWRNNDS